MKRNILLWTLYDFAHSVAEVVFFLYFSQWLVIEKGVSDFNFNLIFVISTLLLVITAPFLAQKSDKKNSRIPYLNIMTLGTFLGFLGTAVTCIFFENFVWLAALFFGLATYFYQFSFVFYNALLEKIAPPNKQGTISGYGQAAKWFGQIVGILISIPFSGGDISLFGGSPRVETFIPAIGIFLLSALPLTLFFREPQGAIYKNVTEEEKIQHFRNFINIPSVGIFLLGYFFFSDAVITASNNFPLYLEQVFHLPDKEKSLALLSILVMSVIGALLSGKLSDRFGTLKILKINLFLWVILFILMASTLNYPLFFTWTVLMGVLFGSVWTLTRTFLVQIVPREELGYAMSFYAIAERFSTLLGPLAWGLTITSLEYMGSYRYQIAMYMMSIFLLIGWLLVFRIKSSSEKNISF